MIAPVATSSDPASPPMMATTGISDSGRAVATAARMLPTAPSPTPSLAPNHSIAFVKSSAPASRIAKLAGRRTAELTGAVSGALERRDLPDGRAVGEDPPEAAPLEDREHCGRRVREGAELPAQQ